MRQPSQATFEEFVVEHSKWSMMRDFEDICVLCPETNSLLTLRVKTADDHLGVDRACLLGRREA